jgi:hypothetical protein
MAVYLNEHIQRHALDFAWFIYEVSIPLIFRADIRVSRIKKDTHESNRILRPCLRYEIHFVITYVNFLCLPDFPYSMVKADSSSTSLEELQIVLYSPDNYID